MIPIFLILNDILTLPYYWSVGDRLFALVLASFQSFLQTLDGLCSVPNPTSASLNFLLYAILPKTLCVIWSPTPPLPAPTLSFLPAISTPALQTCPQISSKNWSRSNRSPSTRSPIVSSSNHIATLDRMQIASKSCRAVTRGGMVAEGANRLRGNLDRETLDGGWRGGQLDMLVAWWTGSCWKVEERAATWHCRSTGRRDHGAEKGSHTKMRKGIAEGDKELFCLLDD